jgi:hypothetical protein
MEFILAGMFLSAALIARKVLINYSKRNVFTFFLGGTVVFSTQFGLIFLLVAVAKLFYT